MKTPAKKTGSKRTAPTLSLDMDSSTPFFYVNCFEVSGSANDFSLSGTRLPIKLTEEQHRTRAAGGDLVFPADVQIVFPPRVMESLIRALTAQLESHNKLVGNKNEQGK